MPDYDVIVVGARVAGAATAMLLARQGLRVLSVDRARFPSDTLSTHQVQLPGVALLRRWGLLDRLSTVGTPGVRQIRLDPGPVVLCGQFSAHDGVDRLYSPRRTVLDALLVDAARQAGAEVREGYRVTELVRTDGRVTGVRGGDGTDTAGLVVGADGKNSLVARATGARPYASRPVATFGCYGYWSGVPLPAGELYQRRGAAVAAFPTNGGLSMVYVTGPIGEFPAFRADQAGRYLAILDRCGDLGERVRAGQLAEHLRGTPDLPNTYRVPYGPGWALVGDAGLVMDPVSAQGIGNALRDAERLAEAVAGARVAGQPLDARLAGYQRARDAATRPMYDFTRDLAALAPPDARARLLLRRLADRPDEIARLLGVFAGTVSAKQYFSPGNALRILFGLRHGRD